MNIKTNKQTRKTLFWLKSRGAAAIIENWEFGNTTLSQRVQILVLSRDFCPLDVLIQSIFKTILVSDTAVAKREGDTAGAKRRDTEQWGKIGFQV